MTELSQRPDETDLIVRCQQQDHQAFGELVERYGGMTYSVVVRLVGDHTQAQDLVQETFVSAFKSLQGFRADAKFSTWLHRIAVNKCKDWLRTHGRRQEQEVQSGEDAEDPILQIPDEHTPEKELSNKQMGVHLEDAIQRLSPLYKEAFVLKHVEGMDYEEMVAVLGVSRDTLKMRVYKARTQLSKELAWLREHQ